MKLRALSDANFAVTRAHIRPIDEVDSARVLACLTTRAVGRIKRASQARTIITPSRLIDVSKLGGLSLLFYPRHPIIL